MKVLLKRIASIFMICSCLCFIKVEATQWINLSSWSYQDVSEFVNSGFLPEKLKSITDYTKPINRGDFAELAWNVIKNIGIVTKEHVRQFADVEDGAGANYLHGIGIVNGYTDRVDRDSFYFPDDLMTREDTATVITRIIHDVYADYSMQPYHDDEYLYNTFNDSDKISEYAFDAVCYMLDYGIMDGIGNSIAPKENISVEQAIVMLNRMYKMLPKVFEYDEEILKKQKSIDLGNDLYEILIGNEYHIYSGNTLLIKLEKDVYQKQLYCEYKGNRLLFAVNFNNKTDVFELDTNRILYTIPYIVSELLPQNGIAVTYSSRFMPVYCGLWDIENNTEKIKPLYSRSEIDEIIQNGFKIPVDKYREADGWIFYIDSDCRLMKIDSNGENKQLLTDKYRCSELLGVADGYIYFRNGELRNSVYCIDVEGRKTYIFDVDSSGFPHFDYPETEFKFPVINGLSGEVISEEERKRIYQDSIDDNSSITVAADKILPLNDGALIGENIIYAKYEGELYSRYDKYYLYNYRIKDDKSEKIKIADFPVFDKTLTADFKGKIFFMNADEMNETGTSSIYMYDGTETKIISGAYKALEFGFEEKNNGEINTDYILFYTLESEKAYCIDMQSGIIKPYDYIYKDELKDDTYYLYNENGIKIIQEFKTDEIHVEYAGVKQRLGWWQNVDIKNVYDGYVYYVENDYLNRDEHSYINRFLKNNALKRYNCLTGKSEVLDSSYGKKWFDNEKLLIYCSSNGQYKTVKDGKVYCTYPNGGIHRYGQTEKIDELYENINSEHTVCKIDTAGNIVPIISDNIINWIYAQNNGNIIYTKSE